MFPPPQIVVFEMKNKTTREKEEKVWNSKSAHLYP
jgi:hypothetical protein